MTNKSRPGARLRRQPPGRPGMRYCLCPSSTAHRPEQFRRHHDPERPGGERPAGPGLSIRSATASPITRGPGARLGLLARRRRPRFPHEPRRRPRRPRRRESAAREHQHSCSTLRTRTPRQACTSLSEPRVLRQWAKNDSPNGGATRLKFRRPGASTIWMQIITRFAQMNIHIHFHAAAAESRRASPAFGRGLTSL